MIQVPLQVEWWQVLANLMRNHFPLVRSHTDVVLTAILCDTVNTSDHVRFHATRAFQQLVTSLCNDNTECVRVWTKALESQLLALVGVSPRLATVVCECLATMTPSTYDVLTVSHYLIDSC